jgi:long-chain acyl-CoA synthetase
MDSIYNASEKSFAKNSELIYDLLDTASKALPDKILFKDSGGRTVSYGEARQLVDNLAAGLMLEGFQVEDRICLIGEQNNSDWCISYLAILKMGAVVVPLDPGLKIGELAVLLKDCEASGIISGGKTIDRFKRLKADIPSLKKIYVLDGGESHAPSSLRDLITMGQGQIPATARVDPDSLAVLIYTSGTTGRPKGVMLSHANILSDLRAIHKRLAFNSDDVVLSILPLHHTFECTCGFLNSISLGLKIVFARSYKSNELLEDIRANKISYMCGVPLLYEKIYYGIKRKIAKSSFVKRGIFKTLFSISSLGRKLKRPWNKRLYRSMREKAGLESLRLLVSGAAALPYEVSRFFNTIGIALMQGYGLSETSPVLSVNSPELIKFASIGKPLDDVEVRIDKTDSEEEGEIIVRGPMVMLGYYNNAPETAKVLRDGWFYTGDIGRMDKDGFLYITGRSKNVIVSAAGKNIHPEEIETLLNESPYIRESLVLGRKIAGSNAEEVAAVIVPDTEAFDQMSGTGSDKEQRSLSNIILAEVNSACSRLADYKRIKKHYIYYDELPKTTTKKIKRCLEIDEHGNLYERKLMSIEASS